MSPRGIPRGRRRIPPISVRRMAPPPPARNIADDYAELLDACPGRRNGIVQQLAEYYYVIGRLPSLSEAAALLVPYTEEADSAARTGVGRFETD